MAAPGILIIDDERNFREFLGEALEAEGYEVSLAANARAGLAVVRERTPQVVLLDQGLPDRTGLEILPQLRQTLSKPVVIMITAYAQYPQAVEAVKNGAYHYLAKPFEFSELLDTLAAASIGPIDTREEPASLAEIVGRASAVLALKDHVTRIASSPLTTVLLQGESGTGKELIARAIHQLSDRAHRPLVCVNCAALTETLLLSELFGHERGAFTDARQQKKGLFEAAEGGTLFLDEISEMALRAQAALLRVLEQRTVMRVGGTVEIPVNVRIIAATNRSLAEAVEEGAVRGDLYHRLNVVQLNVPALRERGADVMELAHYFADQIAVDYGEGPRSFSPEATALLTAYDWPGNVRELRNTVERAYVVGTPPVITPADLPCQLVGSGSTGADAPSTEVAGLEFREAKRRVTTQFERSYLEAALARARGNVTRAAEDAGMVRQVFQRLLKKHGLTAHEFRS